jgi:hypothetical protein
MSNISEKPPICECGAKKLFDPFTSIYYCRECDPKFHEDVLKDIREERARQVREEFLNTSMDMM